jgi:hypothetical protein
MLTLTIGPNLGRATTVSSDKPRWLSPPPSLSAATGSNVYAAIPRAGGRELAEHHGREPLAGCEGSCTRAIEAR